MATPCDGAHSDNLGSCERRALDKVGSPNKARYRALRVAPLTGSAPCRVTGCRVLHRSLRNGARRERGTWWAHTGGGRPWALNHPPMRPGGAITVEIPCWTVLLPAGSTQSAEGELTADDRAALNERRATGRLQDSNSRRRTGHGGCAACRVDTRAPAGTSPPSRPRTGAGRRRGRRCGRRTSAR
jgi:hypothetical protein